MYSNKDIPQKVIDATFDWIEDMRFHENKMYMWVELFDTAKPETRNSLWKGALSFEEYTKLIVRLCSEIVDHLEKEEN